MQQLFENNRSLSNSFKLNFLWIGLRLYSFFYDDKWLFNSWLNFDFETSVNEEMLVKIFGVLFFVFNINLS